MQTNSAINIIEYDVPLDDDLENNLKNTRGSYSFEPYKFENNKIDGKVIYSNDEIDFPIYFIGDIHGDVLALSDCINYIQKEKDNALIMFLGDIIDRKYDQFQCYKMIVELSKTNRVIWLAGNHDVGLKYDKMKNNYFSEASPSECSNEINKLKKRTLGKRKKKKNRHLWDQIEFCDNFLETVSKLPYALYLENIGLLAVHGSLPHDGYIGRTSNPSEDCSIHILEDLNKFENSYLWGRVEDKPNGRYSSLRRDNEVGFENINRTISNLKNIQFDMRYLVFGHQHPINGYKVYNEDMCGAKVVCIQSRYLGNPCFSASSRYTKPCLVCFRNGDFEIIKLLRKDKEVDEFYNK